MPSVQGRGDRAGAGGGQGDRQMHRLGSRRQRPRHSRGIIFYKIPFLLTFLL
jgi:hypothetical protein